MTTRTLYLDNNVLHIEENWSSLRALLKDRTDVRLVISDWHMVELAGGTDRRQAVKRADFIDSLIPLWMRGYFPIQVAEVKRFIWQYYYRAAANPPAIFTEFLSQVWADYVGPETLPGLNASKWVAIVSDQSAINSEKAKIVNVLKKLQTISSVQKKQRQRDIFLSWILPRITDSNPDGKLISKSEKMKVAHFCYDHIDTLYSECPAMAVESELSEIRTRDPDRRPKPSDAIDLPHCVLALAYCDHYVTKDGFARHCATYAKKALPGLHTAEVHKDLHDLRAVLQAGVPGRSTTPGPGPAG